MSTVKANNVQVGQSGTATNNFTLYQPSSPDGTVRLAVGNSGATSADVLTANSSGNVGIGTSSPSYRFDVSGASASGIARFANAWGDGTNPAILVDGTGGDGRLVQIKSGGTRSWPLLWVTASTTDVLVVNGDSTIKTAGTISVGGATPSTSGAGITFPATQSASSNANTLDDYEEGTWTVSLAVSSASSGPTISSAPATYTKIGRLVHITCEISYSGTVMSGVLQITGLPFSAASTPSSSLSVGLIQYWSEATPFPPLTAYANGTRIYMTRLTNAAYGSDQFPTDDNGGTILIGGCYYV